MLNKSIIRATDRLLEIHRATDRGLVQYAISLSVVDRSTFELIELKNDTNDCYTDIDMDHGCYLSESMLIDRSTIDSPEFRQSIENSLLKCYARALVSCADIYTSNITELVNRVYGSYGKYYLVRIDLYIECTEYVDRDSITFQLYYDYCSQGICVDIPQNATRVFIADLFLTAALNIASKQNLNRSAIKQLSIELTKNDRLLAIESSLSRISSNN
jgi:hypothetical protein